MRRRWPSSSLLLYLRDLRNSCRRAAEPPQKAPGKRRGVLVGALVGIPGRGRPRDSLSSRFLSTADHHLPWSCLERSSQGTFMAPLTSSAAPRVVSLLPAATEMVCLVGGQEKLVGRGHEDDFPEEITDRPVVTAARHSFTTSSDIDKKVSESVAKGEGLYFVDALLLKSLRPTVIITQALCSVCAIDYNLVMKVSRNLDPVPQIVSLNPNTFEDILDDILLVGQAIGHADEAKQVVASLNKRIESAKTHIKARKKGQGPRVVFMEWTDPIFCAGHWTPQLIEMAGGEHPLNSCTLAGKASESFRVSQEDVSRIDPDWMIISPCGLDIPTTKREMRTLIVQDWWKNLRAVKENHVVLVDGNQMFNRSGPRIVDAFEWLVGLLNEAPGCMPPGFPWEKWGPDSALPESAGMYPPVYDIGTPHVNNHGYANGATVDKFDDTWVEALHESWQESPLARDIEEAHEAACKESKNMYQDPSTGFMVFTARSLHERGTCCGNRCRHCPFGHYNVSSLKGPRERIVTTPTFMTTDKLNRSLRAEGQTLSMDSLNWSGDISSHFALKDLTGFLRSQAGNLNNSAAVKPQSSSSKVLLCTFFDSMTGRVVPLDERKVVPNAVSPVSLYGIMDQARYLEMPLLAIPVKKHWTSHEVEKAVQEGFSLVPFEVRRLVMGLRDVRPILDSSQVDDRDASLLELARARLPHFWASSGVKARLYFRRGFLHENLQPTVYSEGFLQTLHGSVNCLGSLETFWVHMDYKVPQPES